MTSLKQHKLYDRHTWLKAGVSPLLTSLPELYFGDIVQVEIKGWVESLERNCLTPRCDYFHHLLISGERQSDGDYGIIESIEKGPAVGMLSFYDLTKIRILRITNLGYKPIGRKAVVEACKLGRLDYNFMIFPKVVFAALDRLVRLHLPPWDVYTFHIPGNNKAVACTELIKKAYENAEYPLFDPTLCALPPTFQRAVDKGMLEVIYDPRPNTLTPRLVEDLKVASEGGI